MGDQRFQRHSESIGQGLAGLQHTGPAFVLDFVDSAAGESCLDTEGGLRQPSDQTSLSETGSEYRLTHKSSCTRKYKHMQVHGKSALQTAVSLPGIVCAMAAKTGESDQELDGVILRLEKVREEHELSETAFAKQSEQVITYDYRTSSRTRASKFVGIDSCSASRRKMSVA